eukprot:TRINITY_DN2533_c0_g1_i1.p1 TRINITY_DN2533_c0_g1~~TRINITY_DN2533_c0_g1_i1.p1  ORF type:complete len:275 (-),score=41.20 TRINITY_DN2533_c0_g1_i1:1565-2389(-)
MLSSLNSSVCNQSYVLPCRDISRSLLAVSSRRPLTRKVGAAQEGIGDQLYNVGGSQSVEQVKVEPLEAMPLLPLRLSTEGAPKGGPLTVDMSRRGVLAAFMLSVAAFLNTYKDVFHSPRKLFTRVSQAELKEAVGIVLTHAATLAHFRSQVLQVGLQVRAGFRSQEPMPVPIKNQVSKLLDQRVFEEILVALPIVAGEVLHRQKEQLKEYNIGGNQPESINTILYETLTQSRKAVVMMRKVQSGSVTEELYAEMLPMLKTILDGIEIFLDELHS